MKLNKINHFTRARFKKCPRKIFWTEVAGIQHRDEFFHFLATDLFRQAIDRLRQGEYQKEVLDDCRQILNDSNKMHGLSDLRLNEEIKRFETGLKGYVNRFEIQSTTTEKLVFTGLASVANEEEYIPCIEIKDGNVILHVDRIIWSDIPKLPNSAYALDEEVCSLLTMIAVERIEHEGKVLVPNRVQLRIINCVQDKGHQELFNIRPEVTGQFYNLKTETNHVIDMMQKHVPELHKWPWNSDSCSNSSGQCNYVHLCSNNKQAKMQNYKHTIWRSLDNDAFPSNSH